MLPALLLLLLLPTALCAQSDEDADHRADRERTEQLNRRAASAVERRNDANQRVLADYRERREAYERERAAWRRRFQACQDGDDSACEPRSR